MNYYNEFDRKAAAWLRELIRAGEIPDGIVDERSIVDVQPGELAGYTQCHFFAGIGGWSLALKLAGWPADKPVWTGSCPCQPFSSAGKQLGAADERHLWPAFFRLIRECRPVTVFGEQVATAIGKGWLDGVSADLEQEGYACGATVLGAHSVGAPHIRQRLYWVANTQGCIRGLPILERGPQQEGAEPFWRGEAGGLGHANHAGLEGRGERSVQQPYPEGRQAEERPAGLPSIRSHWDAHDILQCLDGKQRRIEPGSFPLAHGVPGRVGLLRGYGNAIVPQLAAEFIQATY